MVRKKNRYFVVQVEPPSAVSTTQSNVLYNAVFDMVQELHGDFGAASIRSGFEAKFCNEKTGLAILRTRHGPHKIVMSTIPLITSLSGKEVTVRTLYTGATILRCQKFIKKYNITQLLLALKTVKNPKQRLELEKAYLKFRFIERPTETEQKTV